MGLFDGVKRGESPDEVTLEQLKSALASGEIALVDVREPDEFGSGHVAGAINLPLSRFDAAELPQDKPVVLMCKAGGRSAQALAKARGAGRTDVRHYRGGAMGWSSNGEKLV